MAKSLAAGIVAISLSLGPGGSGAAPPPSSKPAARPEASPNAAPAPKPATKTPEQLAAEKKAAEEKAAAEAKEEVEKAAKVEEYLEKARGHVGAEEYEEAATELEAAYRLSREVQVLLDWAHAERFAERCDRAVFLYDRYLEAISKFVSEGNEGAIRKDKDAREGKAECAEDVEQSGAPVLIIPPPITEPKPKPKPEPEPEPEPEPSALEEPVAVTAGPKQLSDKPRWKTDAVGWSLFGAGMFSLAGAGALFAVAYTGRPDPASSPSHGAYLGGIDRSRGMERGAWAFVGIGSALFIAGVVRLAIVSSREYHGKSAQRLRNFGRF